MDANDWLLIFGGVGALLVFALLIALGVQNDRKWAREERAKHQAQFGDGPFTHREFEAFKRRADAATGSRKLKILSELDERLEEEKRQADR